MLLFCGIWINNRLIDLCKLGFGLINPMNLISVINLINLSSPAYTKNGTTEYQEISLSNFDHSPCSISGHLQPMCLPVIT